MQTASTQFIVFGLIVAVLSNLSRLPAWRSFVLMTASVIFMGFAAKEVSLFLPLAGFLLLGYAGIFLLQRGWSKVGIWSILTVFLTYVWLKKYTFLPVRVLLHHPFVTLGLSYVFFRVMHLLIEMREGGEKRYVGPGAYLLYALNFTTLVSGPIQSFDEFAADQFAETPIALNPGVIGLQLERIIRGFFKVNVLGALLDLMRVAALEQINHALPLPAKFVMALRLVVIYPIFLYANFSGYIDIVIALARLMRVRLPENFNRPFSASSFIDFWSRWHMTLSAWFKMYVYNPLLVALMRRISLVSLQPLLGVFCFFVTFFLVGIWHGRTSEFVVYGVLQGGGISINKLWQLGLSRAMGRKSYKAIANNRVYVAFGRGLTFSWFALTLLWLWADWKQLRSIFAVLDRWQWLSAGLLIWLCATAVLAFWEWLRAALLSIKIFNTPLLTSRYALVVYASTLGFTAWIMTILLDQAAPDIVYKAF